MDEVTAEADYTVQAPRTLKRCIQIHFSRKYDMNMNEYSTNIIRKYDCIGQLLGLP